MAIYSWYFGWKLISSVMHTTGRKAGVNDFFYQLDSSVFVCLVYRPPNSSDQYNSSLVSYLNSLHGTENIILLGDMNLPDIDWNTYSGHSSIADDFADLAYDLNLTQYVTGHTHHAGNTLDIALSNINPSKRKCH